MPVRVQIKNSNQKMKNYYNILLIIVLVTIGYERADNMQEVDNSNHVIINSFTEDSSVVKSNYEQVLDSYNAECNKTISIDTSLQLNHQTFYIHFTHYCLFDTLIIPASFNWGPNQKQFLAHNFASKLLVITDNDTLANTIITKDLFNPILFENLVKYGVLFYPNYEGYNSTNKMIQIQYSIPIPLTDVGKCVKLNIGLDGMLSYSECY